MKKYIANSLTVLRMVASFLILLTEPFGERFFILYSFAGFTDMVDGTVARKTGSASKVGAALDTASDFALVGCVLIKLAPTVIKDLDLWIVLLICLIALIKVITYAVGAYKFKEFAALHTLLNKITGGALFLLPYFALFMDIKVPIIVVCILALVAAIDEAIKMGKMQVFDPNATTG